MAREPLMAHQVRIRERRIQTVRREVEVQHLREQRRPWDGRAAPMYAAFSCAAVRVSPITQYTAGRTRRCCGSSIADCFFLNRPAHIPTEVGVGPMMKMSSPQRAANRRPRPLCPACIMTGRPVENAAR